MAITILTNLVIGILMVWVGYLVNNKKRYNLLAGYNDMNKEQRKRVNIKRISRTAKLVLYFMGISVAIIPSTFYLLGYKNLAGKSYPWIIFPAVLFYLIVSVFSINWKYKET